MEKFQWPRGTQAELSVYPNGHPQRIPTEEYFANQVRKDIRGVRSGDGNHLPNLWLLIDSLKELNDRSLNSGFNSWLWAIESVLGADTCREIGERVCREEGFTIEEGLYLQKQNPVSGKELAVYPAGLERGRWYVVRAKPKSAEAKHLAGQLVSVVDFDTRKTNTVSVYTQDVFIRKSGVAIRIPISDLTYRQA